LLAGRRSGFGRPKSPMLSELEYQELTNRFPSLKGANPKQAETLRDQLKPSDGVTFVEAAEFSSGSGLVCLTDTDLYTVWTQKLFLFFKFPAIQTFHRKHLKVQHQELNFQLQAGEEEGQFRLMDKGRAQALLALLSENPS